MIDFSSCPDSGKRYFGSDSKRGIEYNGSDYMIKLPEYKSKKNELQTSHVNNVISEHLGCLIASSLGLPAQETMVGIYKDELVVACKDVETPRKHLVEFSWYLNMVYRNYEIGRVLTYKQLITTFNEAPGLKEIKDLAIRRYWDTFVLDALIGNFDRHKDNWGYLVDKDAHTIELSPIYDCGSSLYPNLSEEMMAEIVENDEEINKRLFVFPKAALSKNDDIKHPEKFGYFEMLTSGLNQDCTDALMRIGPRINIDKINSIIDSIDILSETRKHFYKTMIGHRKERIIDKSLAIMQGDLSGTF